MQCDVARGSNIKEFYSHEVSLSGLRLYSNNDYVPVLGVPFSICPLKLLQSYLLPCHSQA